jgi:hypothetical protein
MRKSNRKQGVGHEHIYIYTHKSDRMDICFSHTYIYNIQLNIYVYVCIKYIYTVYIVRCMNLTSFVHVELSLSKQKFPAVE